MALFFQHLWPPNHFKMKKTFIGFSLLASLACFAQKANNNLTFIKGQTLDVVTNMTISAESMMGPTSGTITTADAYSVADASANAYTLVKVPKQIKMDFTIGSQKIKLDSDKPDEMNPMLAQPVKDIMSRKPEFTIDAVGKIVAVKKDETKKEEDQAPSMMGIMMPGMDFAAAVPKEGNPSFFQILPAHEVGIGETWTDSVNEEGNKNITVYKVKDITDKEIVLDFTGDGTTVTTREAMGTKVGINATTRAAGNILIDKATGIIKQKTSTNTTETKMNLGGQEVASTVKTTLITNVTTR